MNKLQQLINKCNDYYYNSGDFYSLTQEDIDLLNSYGFDISSESPLVTDELYDFIRSEAQKLELYGCEIGATVRDNDSRKVELPVFLPSLQEVKEGEAFPFVHDFVFQNSDNDLLITPKLDGISFLLEYSQGKLVGAYTRGNGIVGQNMLDLALQIADIPNTLYDADIPFVDSIRADEQDIYVRGELILRKSDSLKKAIEEDTGKTFKNLRNLVSGQVNAKDRSKLFLKSVHFVAYKIWCNKNKKFPASDILSAFAEYFHIVKPTVLSRDDIHLKKDKIDTYLQGLVNECKSIYNEYECDGIVIGVDSFKSEWDVPISETNRNPIGFRKFKLTGKEVDTTTVVTKVEWRISKTGLLKPRVHLEAIELGGVEVTHATGFNYKFIKDNGVGKGAIVKIKRAGDVIPHIVEVVRKVEPELPTNYQYELVNGVDAKVTTSTNEERDIKQLCYFCALFKIDQAGEANIRKLWAEGLRTVDDLLLREYSIRAILGKNGEKLWKSLSKTLQKGQSVDPAKYLAGLGVFGHGIGIKVIESVLTYEPDFNKWLQLTIDDLIKLPGINFITATKILKNIKEAVRMARDAEFSGIYLDFHKYRLGRDSSGRLNKIKVVFTGFRSPKLESAFLQQGAVVCSSVTNACNLVVAKDVNATSSKLTKAKQRGVRIISIDEAYRFLGIKQ